MKLSKQERIAVLVIALIILLGLGIFFFIVPKFQAIGESSASLVARQQELQAATERAATKEQLGNDVINAYNEGRNVADMFFEDMTPYEADAAVREFLDYCKNVEVKDDQGNVIKKKLNVSVDSLTVSEPSVSTLGVSFFSEPTVDYELKTYASQGRETPQDVLDAQAREQILQSELSSTQTVGSISAQFTVSALDEEELMAFIDAVNEYQKDENGNTIRKAITFNSGISRTYADVQEKYEDYIADITKDVNSAASKQFEKDTGHKLNIQNAAADTTADNDDNGDNAENNNNAQNNDKTDGIDAYVYSLSADVTFYSIERMQDPSDQLAAQNLE